MPWTPKLLLTGSTRAFALAIIVRDLSNGFLLLWNASAGDSIYLIQRRYCVVFCRLRGRASNVTDKY
jgi:hypothetical protein